MLSCITRRRWQRHILRRTSVKLPMGPSLLHLMLAPSDSNNHLNRLLELDDGSATSEVRIALARFMVGMREGRTAGLLDLFASAEHLLTRLSDPHLLSSFYVCHGALYALSGQYDQASTSRRASPALRNRSSAAVCPPLRQARRCDERVGATAFRTMRASY